MNATKAHKFSAAVLIAFGFAVGTVTPQVASAACQTNSGSSASSYGAYSYGASVAGGSVTICAQTGATSAKATTSSTAIKTTSTSKPTAAPVVKVVATPVGVAKPNCPTSTVTTTDIIIAASMGCPIYGYTTPPAPIAKVTTTVKPTTNVAIVATVANQDISFTPNAVVITASPATAEVFEAVFFSNNAEQHFRSGTLLGQPAEVRFSPVSQSWNFGDGSGAAGSVFSHGYGSVGNFVAQLTVNYEVASRVAGQAAWSINGTIAVTAEASINVVKKPSGAITLLVLPNLPIAKPTPHLVSTNCFVKASNYRCGP